MTLSNSHAQSISLPTSTPVSMPIPSSMWKKSSVAIMPVARPVPQYGHPPIPPTVPSSTRVSWAVSARIAAYADGRAIPLALCR